MAIRNRLNHVAAGLLSSFYSRCNEVDGFWALGMLYKEVLEAPHCVTLDLLSRTAMPARCSALYVTGRYAEFLERALAKKDLRAGDLTKAEVRIRFKADTALPSVRPDWIGDVFTCTVVLQRADDRALLTAYGKCMPNDPALFRQSARRRGQ